jgi:hypothetical protein
LRNINNGQQSLACTSDGVYVLSNNMLHMFSGKNCVDAFYSSDAIISINSNNTINMNYNGVDTTLTQSNGIPNKQLLDIVLYNENSEIKSISSTSNSYVRSTSGTKVNTFVYPVSFTFLSDYDKTSQVANKISMSSLNILKGLSNPSSSDWNKLTTINGAAANFIFVRILKPNGANSIWYMFGDDGRRETEYQNTCKEFGILVG